MKFNDVQFASRYKEDAAKRDSLGVRLARLKAEAEGAVSPTFPETQGESAALKESVEVEELLFRIRRADLTATRRVYDEKIKFRTEKLRLLMPLFLDGTMSEIAELRGQIETNETAFRRLSMEQYDEERLKLRALEESIRAEEDRLARTTFVSPVDGTVNKIFVDSPGRVVQGGQSIMEVVPKEDTLLVEAKIRPADVAFIKEGHRVVLRFTAYDFTTYGGMDGEVETLGVDTIAGEDKDVYYPVRIRTASNSLGHDRVTGEALVLRPGMVAEVDILTGERTVLDYLLKPIHRARKLALRER
jgi:adhesin transport system membrane fusion protein